MIISEVNFISYLNAGIHNYVANTRHLLMYVASSHINHNVTSTFLNQCSQRLQSLVMDWYSAWMQCVNFIMGPTRETKLYNTQNKTNSSNVERGNNIISCNMKAQRGCNCDGPCNWTWARELELTRIGSM